jgi:hypothetical protein
MQRLAMMVVGAGLLALGIATNVSAQVCGDADGSGAVTVTDGVQVLRAAADLSSDCTQRKNSCDVDGNGTVTVSDGVNVLRKAADLPVTDNCPGGSGVDADVSAVLDVTVPLLTVGLSALGEVSIGSASAAATEDCEDGGSRTTSSSGVVFNACRVSQPGLGRFQFDGVVDVSFGIPTSSVSFELHVTDLDADTGFVDFVGTIQGQVRVPQGGFVVDGGPVQVRDGENGPVIVELTFHDLTIDSDAHLVSGSVQAEDTGNRFDDLATAELEVESSTTATLHVVRDDQSEDDFTIDLATGDITPVP